MSNLQAKEINILKTLQKRAIRIVFGCKFNSHTSKLFKWSKITKVEDIFEKQSIIFCKKHQENNLPLAIMKIVNENLRNQDVMTRISLTKNYIISDKIIKGDTMYDILASWNKQSEKITRLKRIQSKTTSQSYFGIRSIYFQNKLICQALFKIACIET